MERTEVIRARVKPILKERLVTEAKSRGLSESEMLRLIVVEHYESRVARNR